MKRNKHWIEGYVTAVCQQHITRYIIRGLQTGLPLTSLSYPVDVTKKRFGLKYYSQKPSASMTSKICDGITESLSELFPDYVINTEYSDAFLDVRFLVTLNKKSAIKKMSLKEIERQLGHLVEIDYTRKDNK